jgi:nitric oxide reductase NorD protein
MPTCATSPTAAGHVPVRQDWYRSFQGRERDLACLLLADLSLSTDTWVNNQERVIDVIRDSLFLFSEAMSATGDRFALWGFSSRKRADVRMHCIKGFDERYTDAIRGRIAVIKPGFYTRMGAAVRHATRQLEKEVAGRRLLLLLTDGKPNDLDQYEGRYGIEDTRMALREARRAGLHPFCVTIDDRAGDYLPWLFGSDGYVVIRRPAELPVSSACLPALYWSTLGCSAISYCSAWAYWCRPAVGSSAFWSSIVCSAPRPAGKRLTSAFSMPICCSAASAWFALVWACCWIARCGSRSR